MTRRYEVVSDFMCNELRCVLIVGDWINGYCQLPEGHQYHGFDTSDFCDAWLTHITYADGETKDVFPVKADIKNTWWVGFDTMSQRYVNANDGMVFGMG